MAGAAPFDLSLAAQLIEERRALPGATLPILHALQERFGFIDDAAIPLIAKALNLSKAEIHGVVSFYHDFRKTPADAGVLKICRAESCQAAGSEALVAHLARKHGLAPEATVEGAALTVESVYCLGNCALSPAALLDGVPVGRLDKKRLDAIVKDAKGRRQ